MGAHSRQVVRFERTRNLTKIKKNPKK